jgi:hypothetical protein
VIQSQPEFDKVFGVAMVMHDKSHRLAKDAFDSNLVIAAIKRGAALWTYKVDGVAQSDGVVELRYIATAQKQDSATFACPLILSIPKGQYKAVQFVENGKAVKTISLSAGSAWLGDATVGELPKGWRAAKTGDGPVGVWKVVEDATAKEKKVLAQTSSEIPRKVFNLCVDQSRSAGDVDLTVAFKAVAGKIDQGGGPVWHYVDADNYYVARVNPLEDNYRVYKVVAGKRTQLGDAVLKTSAGKWYTLRVVQKGDHIQCYFDGKPYLDVHDGTFKDGKIGLWTKADAQTYFAGLKVAGE